MGLLVERWILFSFEKHSKLDQWIQFFVPAGQTTFPFVKQHLLFDAVKRVFSNVADLSFDIPLIHEFCGALLALVLVPNNSDLVKGLLPMQTDLQGSAKILCHYIKYCSDPKLDSLPVEPFVPFIGEVFEKQSGVLKKFPNLENILFLQKLSVMNQTEFDVSKMRNLVIEHTGSARKSLANIAAMIFLQRDKKPASELVDELIMVISPMMATSTQPSLLSNEEWRVILEATKGDPQLLEALKQLSIIPDEIF